MFLAMNRFKIVKGKEQEFERVWKERDTHLEGVKGFVKFNLLKGAETESYSLYALTALGRAKTHLLIGPNLKLLNLLIKTLAFIEICT